MGEEKKAPWWEKIRPILDVVGGKWIRPLTHNVGGRKMLLGGGALAVIDRIVQVAGTSFGWPHAVACLAVSFAAGATSWAIAHEDRGNNANTEGE